MKIYYKFRCCKCKKLTEMAEDELKFKAVNGNNYLLCYKCGSKIEEKVTNVIINGIRSKGK